MCSVTFLTRTFYLGMLFFMSYTFHNMQSDTLKLFLSLFNLISMDVKPDKFKVTCVLKALALLFSNLILVMEVHCFILQRGLVSHLFVVYALILEV